MNDLSSNIILVSFIVGLFLSICTSLLSPILVSKQMANLSNGMSHATLGGLAIALMILPASAIETPHLIIAMIFISLCALVISFKSSRNEQDSSIAVLFAGAMALGPFLNSITKQNFDYSNFLFGNLLLTDITDLYLIFPILITTIFSLIWFKKLIIYWIFDDHFLFFKGARYKFIPILFVVLCSITIVLATKVTGIILMTTMLVVPGILSLRRKKTFLITLGISTLFGIFSYMLGFFLEYYGNIPIGSTIALTQVALYFLPLGKK